MPIILRVLLFAQVRELAGGSEAIEISVESETITPQEVRQKVSVAINADQSLSTLLDRSMVAIDNEYAMDMAEAIPIREGIEIAIIPPVSGGWMKNPSRIITLILTHSYYVIKQHESSFKKTIQILKWLMSGLV